MKLFKRVLSVALALVMCIPSNLMSVAYAAELDNEQSSYIVMLETPENGSMAFTKTTDDFMTVSSGEMVELVLQPDEGYAVDMLLLKDADNGSTIASKKTTDNVFSFTMPPKDLTVAAKFIEAEDISVNSNSANSDKLEDINNAEDITPVSEEDGEAYEVLGDDFEELPIADKEIDKLLSDVEEDAQKNESSIDATRTTAYIANNMNEAVVEEVKEISQDEITDEAEPTIVQTEVDKVGLIPTYHTILVNYNLADASNAKLASANFDASELVTSVAQMQQIYTIDDNEDCFVAFIDLGKLNGAGSSAMATFSNSDVENAISYSDIIKYDNKTGIAYIPKSLFYNEKGEEIVVDLQAQVYVPYTLEEQNKNVINLTIENNGSAVKEVAKSQKLAVPSFDVTITLPITTPDTAKNLDMSKVSLYVNDATIPTKFSDNEYFFNKETGELTIAEIPVTVYSIKVVIDGETLASRMIDTITMKSNADIARQVRYESDIKMIPDVYLDIDYNSLQVNHSEIKDTTVTYQTNEAMNQSDKDIVRKYAEYLCYVGNNYTNSLWAAESIQQGSAQLGNFANDTRTDFGDSTGTTFTADMLELYNYLFEIPELTNSGTTNKNQKLPLHSIMLFQGEGAEAGVGSTNASDLASRPLAQKVVIRCLHKDTKNGIQYGVFGFSVETTDGKVAAYGIYKIPVNTPVGYIQIVKESLYPDATNGNESYTFEGAQFQILKGNEVIRDERTGADIFTLDSTGKSDTIAVPILNATSGDTYVVKEIRAPKGFKKAADQTVVVNRSHTASSPAIARFVEEPYVYDADIKIDKLDKISTYSEGNASLAGIKFEVLYYAGSNKDDFSSLSGNPTRRWVITTKAMSKEETVTDNGITRTYTREYGHTELEEEYLVVGSDPLYKDNNGNVIMPLGTYVVRELETSDGYKISGEMYIMQDGIKEPNFSSNKQGTTDPAQGIILMVKANIPETPDYRTEIDSSGPRLADYEVYKTTGYIGTTAPNGVRVTNIIKPESVITVTDTVKYGGFSVQKYDLNDRTPNPQGDADDMSGRYGVKNLSDHAVTIKSENGIQINTGYASKCEVINGIRYYTFEPVADNNMSQYMFTFNTNYYGFFQSSNSLLPYGKYEIDEIEEPVGYQKNGVVTVKFEIREDGKVVEAPGIYNMIDRGGIFLVKFDADDEASTNQGSGILQGTYTITNRSAHYVWIRDNEDITILKENADKKAGAVEITELEGMEGLDAQMQGTWYKFAPGVDMFTFTTVAKDGYAAMFRSDPYLLPYGTYEIRETGTSGSYIVSEDRRGSNRATFSITKTGDIAEFGTRNGQITDADSIMKNPVVRGGFTVQKNDADVKEHKDGGNASSRTPQGDASFTNATYKVTTDNDNYVWIKEENGITILTENAATSKEIDGEMWYKFNKGADMFTFKVNANGDFRTSVELLPFGTYTITEIESSTGYLVTDERGAIIKQQFSINEEGEVFDLTYAKDEEDGDYNDSLYEAVIRGGVKIQKNDADVYDHLSTTAQGDATFEGATYDIYNISKNYVWVDTNNDGEYSEDEYYKPLNINTANEITLTHEDLADATPVYTITTDATGIAQTGNKVLPYGSYLIVEREPSEGYLNGTMRYGIVAHTFEIREEGVIVDKLTYVSAEANNNLEGTFYEPIIRGGFDFQKNDEETGTNVPLGGTNLHATFSVTNISDSYVWIKAEDGIELKTDAEDHYYDEETGYHLYKPNEVMFTFETDAHTGKFVTSNVLLPYGTYKITEIVPPEGYLIESNRNNNFDTTFVVRNEAELVDVTQSVYDYAMRGNVFFEKKDAETGIKMTYIPFLITALDQDGQPIESHVVYTDKNGSFGSSSMYTIHSYKTNKADETVSDIDKVLELILSNNDSELEEYMKDGQYYTKDSIKDFFEKENYGMGLGVWFGVGTEPIDDERTATLPSTGALPFGRYRLDELPCEANEGKALVHDMFTIANEECKTTKKNNPLRYQLGSMAAGNINFGTIYNWEKTLAPQMTTEAVVRASDTQYSGTDSTMVIVDTVHYQGIDKNKDYTLQAMVADAETGEYLRDVTGDIAMTTEFFTPNTSDGYIKMEISVDTTGYEGRTVVVYETLYDEHGDIYVNHCDPTDEKQQVHFPNLTTGVVVEETGKQVSIAGNSVTIIDTVSYSNLSVGIPYTIKSYLIDSETGAVITDASGRRIESEQAFKPTLASGTFDVTFIFDASALAGKKVIVCEEIMENGYVISSHADKNNDKQAVWFPDVVTNAVDRTSGTAMSLAENRVVITDKVDYFMVQPNLTYTVNGRLVDAESGKTVATATSTITPAKESGSANVTFTFDGVNLAGRTVVALATIDYDSHIVAVHEDMKDVNETVYIPSMSTVAIDGENSFKLSKADAEVTIIDTVRYENLVSGNTYIVSGYLVDAESGMMIEDANGESISASEAFVAENTNGEVEVEFTFDGSKLAGRTVVVFESINVETENDVPLVAVHEDIRDENQTMRFPKLVGTAMDRTNLEHITKPGTSTLVDVVSYSNVIPNVEYTIVGKLVVKETREVLDTTEVKFTATASSGTVEVEYTVDTSKLNGQTLVFVEDLQYNKFSVAEINNLNDKSEAIYVPFVDTKAVDGENGTQVSNADESVTITDTVTYTNLIPNKQYVMFGRIIDQATGEPVSAYIIDEPAYDERGDMHEKWVCQDCGNEFTSRDDVLNHVDASAICETYLYELYYDKIHHDEVGHYGEIIAIKPFIATSSSGTVIMEFNFNGIDLEDKKVVVYEEILMENEDGIIITEHFDCVQCGAQYGTKEDVEQHFRDSDTGCNTYSFYYTTDMFSVGEHKERYDDDQTIFIPKLTNPSKGAISQASFFSRMASAGIIGMTHADSVASIPNGNHYIQAGKGSIVNDTVTYTTLRPGNTYTIVGTLVDKESGVPTNITASTTFVATQEKADVELVFEFDSDEYEGRLLVATEIAYVNGTDQVAKYYDLDDLGKTIYIVKVDSDIKDDNTDDNVPQYGKTTITDTVTVSGLKPGTEYIGRGKLVDPETGEEYKNIPATISTVSGAKEADGSSQNILEFIADRVKEIFSPVTSNETIFTATSTTAVFKITYELDTSTMQGKSVVSFVEVIETENNSKVGDHKDPEDEDQTLYVPLVNSSTIIDAYTGNKQVMLGKTAVADKMTYENLMTGKTYVAKANLKDVADGAILATTEEEFIASESVGEQQLTFYVDSSKVIGKTLYIEEELYLNGVRVGFHSSNKETDLLYVAEITTNAISEKSASQAAPVAGRTTIIDTVTYKNLIPGETYMVTGSLVDQATQKDIVVYDPNNQNGEGKESISVTFTPNKANGTVDVAFSVDTREISGKTLVGYETIAYNNYVVAEHKNPNDPAQSILIPKISSTANDKDTGNKLISGTTSATVVDTINVGNLVVGTEYTINAVLADKETGTVVYNASKKFVADSANMTVSLELPLNALDYVGRTLVLTDSLSVNGVELIVQRNVHEFYVGAITTSVRDRATGIGMAEYDIDTKIIDTVTYNNFVPNLEYTIHGELISKKTGKVLDTQDVKTVFKERKGSVDVEFEIDTTKFDGRQFVAVETVMFNGVVVASHDDLNDNKQTMNVAEIGTEAFINGMKEVRPNKSTLLLDTVDYYNLRTGYEYDMIGSVVDVATGQVVTCNEIPVTSTVSFTPDESNGVIDVPFTFDTTGLEGRKVVVFEELRYNNTLIAVHNDINSAKQTVTIVKAGTVVEEPKADAKVVVKYLDQNGLEISPETVIRGKVGDSYLAQAKTIAGYKLVNSAKNAKGVMTEKDIEVIFLYDVESVKEDNNATVVVKYLDTEGKAISDATVIEGKTGDPYKVEAKAIDGYELTEMPKNAEGKIADGIEVVFVYKLVKQDSNEANARVTARYLDEDGLEIAPATTITGKVGEAYEIKAKEIKGYKVVQIPDNAKGTMTKDGIEVLFIYQLDVEVNEDEATILVKYVDVNGNAISETTVLKGKVGDEYEVKAKDITGYELQTMPNNATGKFAEGVTVTFVYKAVASDDKLDAKVIVRYTENINGTEIAEQTVIAGKVGDHYTTSAKAIEGYKVYTTPSNHEGIMQEKDTVVTYIYEKTTVSTPELTIKNTPSNTTMTIGTPLRYTIVVTATNAEAKNVVVTESFNDRMVTTNGTSTLKAPNVVFNKDSVSITRKDGKAVSAKSIQFSDNGTMTIELDSIAASEVITITYTVTTNDSSLNNQSISSTTTVKADNASAKAVSQSVTVKAATTDTTTNNGGNTANSNAGNSNTSTSGNNYTSTNGNSTFNGGSTVTSNASTVNDGVKTGDNYTWIIILVALIALMGGTSFVLLRKKKK